jgi:diguanylate cyclase (GGDEF)-like protein
VRAGLALATGGVLAAAVPTVAWVAGGGGPAAIGAGAALGLVGGIAHLVVLRRALARQAGGLVAQVYEIGDRVLTAAPRPGAGPAAPTSADRADGAPGDALSGDPGSGNSPEARPAPAVPTPRGELLEETLTTLLMSARDGADRLRVEADLLHQAAYDALTGLPNRASLLRLAAEAVTAARPDRPLSVLMIDLDRFKDVNDSLGHAIGDQLLALVGPRLRAALRPVDSIARLGGDEFAVLLPSASEDGARRVAERLTEALDAQFVIDGVDLRVEASVGIAVSHRPGLPDSCTVEGLLREAEIAMYRAKEEGAAVVLFEPGHDSGNGRSRLELSAELRRAITEGQLVLHYQPVVDVVEGRLAGVEALVRWQHPERGLLPPGVFLPLAEQTGLIIPLSRFVLDAAVTQAAAWRREGSPVQIAINMSPRWLQHADVPQAVSSLLDVHDLPPELLRLEITESVVLAHPQHAHAMLSDLRSMGIGLSLDDFGTGYSSMTRLRNLPVDELKVDRGFVHAMTTSPEDAVIVRAAVELGHNLGMDVVAEGIENADTLAEIVAAGCSLAQGYYFSKALPADELISWAVDRFPGFGHGDPAARRSRPPAGSHAGPTARVPAPQ